MAKGSCCLFGRAWRGWLAGAAGTTALNLTTYGDMALTGRGASSVPAALIAKLAHLAGFAELSSSREAASEITRNRQDALGAIAGLKTGIYVGGAAGILQPVLEKIPLLLRAALIGGAAMAISDISMAKLEVSDPSKWTPVDWARDAVPHYVYGLVTAAALEAFDS